MPETLAVALPAVLIVAALSVVLIRLFAARKVRTGRARYAWLFFAPNLVLAAVPLWLAATQASTHPLLAVILGVVGVGYGLLLLRLVRAVAGATSVAGSEDDLVAGIAEPTADFMLIATIAMVIGLILVGLGAIVVALAERGT